MPGGVGDPSTPMHVPALVDLVSRLSESFEITVYSVIKPDGDARPFRCGNAAVKFIDAHYDDSMLKRIYRFTREFRKDHRKNPYALVHGFWALPCGLAAVISGRTSGLRSIVSLQGGEAASLPEIGYGSLRRQPSRGLTLWTCRRANALTLLTRFQQETLRRNGGFEREATIIPYGAADHFLRAFEKKVVSPPVRILHVGQLSGVKDQATLMNAIRILKPKVNMLVRMVGESSR